MKSRKKEDLSCLELYIHIPFCVRKCAYCDFLSFPSGEEERERYVERLTEEIEERVLFPRLCGDCHIFRRRHPLRAYAEADGAHLGGDEKAFMWRRMRRLPQR